MGRAELDTIKDSEMELLNVEQVARLVCIGTRTVWRLRDSGKMPAAVRIGGCIRWRRSDIEAWIGAGCPDVKRTNWTLPAAGCAGGGHCHA